MSVISQTQPETEIVSGTVVGIIQKGVDKWQVAVQPEGSQYSKNLWTKDVDLVTQLSGLIGQQMSFQCGISHWVRQDGQPVRSLWVNGVGPASAAAPQAAAPPVQPAVPQQWSGAQQPAPPQQVVQATQQFLPQPSPVQEGLQRMQAAQPGLSGYMKDANIMRQCASKVAAILLGYLPQEERTFDTLLIVSQRLVRYYEAGMESILPQQGDFDGAQYGTPPDDIPF